MLGSLLCPFVALGTAVQAAPLVDAAHSASLAAPTRASAGDAVRPRKEREERVVALIREMYATRPGWRYPSCSFERPRDAGPYILVPNSIAVCGNAQLEIAFQPEYARAQALELMRIFGLDPRTNEPLFLGGGQAVIDGLDVARRVGFELRGLVPDPERRSWRPEWEEPAEVALDPDEHAELERTGFRIHVANLEDYCCYDSFTPTLAYLAGLVLFLNDVTDGEEVDLSAILMEREQYIPFPPLEEVERSLPPGVVCRVDKGYLLVEVRERCELALQFSRAGDPPPFARRWPSASEETLVAPVSTAACPTVVGLTHGWDPLERNDRGRETALRYRLVQEPGHGAPGCELDWVPGRTTALFPPTSFDAARPFFLLLDLGPGRHQLSRRLLVGAPASGSPPTAQGRPGHGGR